MYVCIYIYIYVQTDLGVDCCKPPVQLQVEVSSGKLKSMGATLGSSQHSCSRTGILGASCSLSARGTQPIGGVAKNRSVIVLPCVLLSELLAS